jgi:epoxide hydrolase-like predicted phosphatase
MVSAVVFDYGGVLTTPLREAIRAWQAADGIDPASFTEMLKEWLSPNGQADSPLHRLETGALSATEFSIRLAARLRAIDGRRIDPDGLLSRLFAGLRPEPAMLALARHLREQGLAVGVLSNSWGNSYPRQLLDSLFDPVVISGEVGLRKPLPAIYELTCQRLGLPASQVLFVDDAEPNVAGARAVGLPAIRHTDPVTTRAAIARWVPGLTAGEPG